MTKKASIPKQTDSSVSVPVQYSLHVIVFIYMHYFHLQLLVNLFYTLN